MIRNHLQEALSRAYIHAVAARCGFGTSPRDYDYGIDLTVHEIRRRGNRYMESGHRLDVQAKSTAANNVTPSDVHYDIKVKNYDDLRTTDIGGYRVLVLLVLPEEETRWLEQSDDALLLRHAAYWYCLKGLPEVSNTSTVRLTIPRTNLFTVHALKVLMAKVRKEEPL